MPAKSFISFKLNDQLFGIDILQVSEINRQLDMTSIPTAPEYVVGLANLRGQIITVLNLKERLGIETEEDSPISHHIILKSDSEIVTSEDDDKDLSTSPDKCSLWVDEIGDVITVERDEIDDPPSKLDSIDAKHLDGAVKLPDTLLTVLNIGSVLHEQN